MCDLLEPDQNLSDTQPWETASINRPAVAIDSLLKISSLVEGIQAKLDQARGEKSEKSGRPGWPLDAQILASAERDFCRLAGLISPSVGAESISDVDRNELSRHARERFEGGRRFAVLDLIDRFHNIRDHFEESVSLIGK